MSWHVYKQSSIWPGKSFNKPGMTRGETDAEVLKVGNEFDAFVK